MKRILVDYDEATGMIYDITNKGYMGTITASYIIDAYKEKQASRNTAEVIALKEAGFTLDEILRL